MLTAGIAALTLVFFLAVRPAAAQSPAPGSDGDRPKDKIHIVADVLTTDNAARIAEFAGNVRATQGETVITSDRLKIFYSEKMGETQSPSTGQGAIKKIVADGNVKISFDNRVATAQEAVYHNDTQVLVLSGPQSKISSGDDSITGEKITYHRTDGRITVERGRSSRVEAVFHSKEGGIQ